MGDPKKQKKKYRRPLMVWNEERIARDKETIEEYGLKNKKEIWRVESHLKSIHDQAKKLIADPFHEQNKKESALLLKKLISAGLLPATAKLEEVLSLNYKDLMDRRLQTLVYKRGLAKTSKQARQFISHNHIAVGPQVINVPSYLVKISEEHIISINSSSSISNEMHPERVQKKEENLLKEIKPKESKKEVKDEVKKEVQEEMLENAVPVEEVKHKEK